MKAKKLTIAIPVKNEADTIGDQLTRMLDAYQDIAIFMVSDNASTDESLVLLQSISSRYNDLKIFAQKEDIGAEGNFKFLLNKSKTKYFMWVGGDDVLQGDLQPALGILDRDAEIGAISFVGSFRSTNSGNLTVDKCNAPILYGDRCKRLCSLLLNPGANSRFYSIYRRSALVEKIDAYVTGMLGADMYFSLCFVADYKWDYSDKVSLVRSYGISSNPLQLRERYGFYGISKFIFFPKFLVMILKLLLSKRCFLGVSYLILYWLRLFVSPLKHYVNDEL